MDYPMSIEFEGQAELESALKWYMNQLSYKQRKRHLAAVGRLMKGSIRKNITAGGREGGGRGTWPKLKRQQKPTKPGRFGRKAKGLVHKSGKALQGKYKFLITASLLSDAAVMIGFRSPLAQFHEFGLGHNPRRRAIMYQAKDRKRIIDMARKHIDREALRGVR